MTLARRRWRNVSITILVAIALVAIHDAFDTALYSGPYLSGWMLFAAIVGLALYRSRKSVTMLPIGSAAIWMRFHANLGTLAVVLFVLHVGWRIPNGSIEIVLAAMFVLVALSGVVGLAAIWSLPRRLTRRGEEVIWERIPTFLAELRGDAEQIVLKSVEETESSTIQTFYLNRLHAFFAAPRNIVHHLLASNRPLFSILNEMGNMERYLSPKESAFAGQLRDLVLKKDDLDFHYALQLALKAWLLVHVPLTFGLLVFALAHMFLVHAFGGGV